MMLEKTAVTVAPRHLVVQPARRTGHAADNVLFLLLIVGFFLGPMKMMGNPWIAYLLPDLLAVLAILLCLGGGLFPKSPLTKPILLLGLYCILELANPNSTFLRSILGLRSWLLYLGMYFVGINIFRSVRQLQWYCSLLVILGVVTGLYGVYQWYQGPEAIADWSEHYAQQAGIQWLSHTKEGKYVLVWRALSTFVAAGSFGGNMSLVMALAFSVAISRTVSSGWRLISVAAFAVMAMGIAASGSRSAVVRLVVMGAMVPFLFPGLWSKMRLSVSTSAVLAVALVLVSSYVGPVVSERFASLLDPMPFVWQWYERIVASVKLALDNPLGLGLGYTAGVPSFLRDDPLFRDLQITNMDSGYGSVALELGLLGLLLFIYFAFKTGIEGLKAWKKLPPGRLKDLLLGPALWAGALPVFSIIEQPQASLPSDMYFWLLVGMLMKASALQGSSHANRLLRPALHARK